MKKTKTNQKTPTDKHVDPSDADASLGKANDQTVDRDSAADASTNGGGPDIPETTEQLKERIAKLEDNMLRVRADYQNAQRRAAVERAESIRYANADLMKSLLGVIDDFDRTLVAAETTDHLDAVVDGVRLVHQNLVAALASFGLQPVDALGRSFDPAVHEALMEQPSSEHEPGHVIEEVARGYHLWDRVLRPAKVIVSKAVDPSGGESIPGQGRPTEQTANDSQG